MFNRSYWLVKGLVIVAELSGTLELADLDAALDEIAHELSAYSKTDRVYLILDMSGRTDIDNRLTGVSALVHWAKRMRALPAQPPYVIVDAQPHPVLKHAARLIENMELMKLSLELSIEDAMNYWSETDPRLSEITLSPSGD
ncbi:MAG: hypothetical protein SF162_06030 [bacterium]|nr:hypothetical protein [bacterium]